MQGCNPSAALEAGAGGAWQHALPSFSVNLNQRSSMEMLPVTPERKAPWSGRRPGGG